jgi:prepilin signal peptidase PulO-like enzyme (type II secretory pathway)
MMHTAAALPVLSALFEFCPICFCLLAARADMESMIIPDRLLAAFALSSLFLCASVDAASLPRRLLACALSMAFFGAFRAMARGGFGLGDVKLIALLAFSLGAVRTLAMVALACVASILWAVFSKKARREKMPFAPWLCVGTFAVHFMKG